MESDFLQILQLNADKVSELATAVTFQKLLFLTFLDVVKSKLWRLPTKRLESFFHPCKKKLYYSWLIEPLSLVQ